MKDNKWIKDMELKTYDGDVILEVIFKDDKLNTHKPIAKFNNMLLLIKHIFPKYSNYISYEYDFKYHSAVGQTVYPVSVNNLMTKYLIYNDFIYYKTKDDIISTIDKLSEFINSIEKDYDILLDKFNKS